MTECDTILSRFFEDPSFRLLNHLFAFVTEASKERKLNFTLGGYFNKVVSFFLIHRPNEMLAYFAQNQQPLESLLNHLYLAEPISDLIVRIITAKYSDDDITIDTLRGTLLEMLV